ncbi:MAG: LytTR family DNA-binding domain-containing protein [Bacteroidota bacterium]
MNCIIVDDDEISRSALRHLVEEVEDLNLVKVCASASEAIDTLKKNKIDLVFLDIEMPEMSGIELIKSLETRPLIILTTSHKEYALDAFEYNVVDYLIKPLLLPRFLKAVDKAREFYDSAKDKITSTEKDYFFIKHGSVLTKVMLKDILWIEALGDYITINTANKKFVLHLTLKAIESKLPPDKFVRVHRSYIAAVDNITSVEDTTISINNKLIPVGALYKDNFIKRLNLL